MKLFSKLKDYNTMLESILDNKYFSSSSKNLLLSMIYKIETSYKDYKIVKRKARSREDLLEEILNNINVYCDNIQTVEPDSDQAKMLIKNKTLALTNERERSILAYPTEISLLYAISDIEPKYFYIPKDFLFKEAFQNILVEGYNANIIELLNNFNGWSWDTNQRKEINVLSNLIYQNLLMIKGEEFLCKWKCYASNKINFLLELQETLRNVTGSNEYFLFLCRILYRNTKDKKEINSLIKYKYKALKAMQNKEEFLKELKIKKEKSLKSIEKIEQIVEDDSLLIKEFNKRNSKLEDVKKILNIKSLKHILEKEKEELKKNVEECEYLEKSSNFAKRKNELIEFLEIVSERYEEKEEILHLQEAFLKYMDKKLSEMTERNEYIDMIYELRYYRNILIYDGVYTRECKELEDIINKILKKIITKCCKIGYMKIFSMDINLNYEIISYAIDTKIIELEEIKVYFEFSKDEMTIKVFDKEIFEKQGKKEIENPSKKLEVKQKKMLKIFN